MSQPSAYACPRCSLTIPIGLDHPQADCDAFRAGKPFPPRVELAPSWFDEAKARRKRNGVPR